MIYAIVFASTMFFIYLALKKEKMARYFLYISIAMLIPSVVAGIRDYTIGNDVLLYGNIWFDLACNYDSLILYLKRAVQYSIGPGYALINFLVSRFSNNAHVFYFIYELFFMVIAYKALKPFRAIINIPYAMLIFMLGYYNSSLNILRQIMAIDFVLYSFQFIVKKEKLKFAISILIAASFHETAMIGFVLYPLDWAINNKVFGRINKALIIVVCSVICVLFGQIMNIMFSLGFISQRYTQYIIRSSLGGRFIRLIYWVTILIIFISRRKRCQNNYEKSETLFIITCISTICSVLAFVGGAWIIRVVYYFDIISVISIPFLASNMGFCDVKKKLTPSYVILLIFPMLFWIITYMVRGGGDTYPYMFMRS